MGKVRWTTEAEFWLHDIHDYIARDNPAAAQRTVELIYKKAEILEEFREMGHLDRPRSGEAVRILLWQRTAGLLAGRGRPGPPPHSSPSLAGEAVFGSPRASFQVIINTFLKVSPWFKGAISIFMGAPEAGWISITSPTNDSYRWRTSAMSPMGIEEVLPALWYITRRSVRMAASVPLNTHTPRITTPATVRKARRPQPTRKALAMGFLG